VQRVDSAGTPRATLTAEKVVLDTTNENALWSVVSAVGFSSVAAGGGSGSETPSGGGDNTGGQNTGGNTGGDGGGDDEPGGSDH